MERSHSYKKIVLVTALLFLPVACRVKDRAPQLAQQYGREYNPVRQELGIAEIPSDWVRHNKFETEKLYWKNPQGDRLSDDKKPHHYWKLMVFMNGKPEWERDEFYSGRRFEYIDGNASESIWIIYHYDWKRRGKYPWKCSFRTGVPSEYIDPQDRERYPIHFEYKDISLKEAKRILARWGLKYP